MNELLAGWAIGLHLVTFHAGIDRTKGDTVHEIASTPGIYAVAPSGLTFGAYRNSLSDTAGYPGSRVSAYAGWTWRLTDDLSVTGGLATGYIKPISPIAAVSYRLGSGPYAPRVLWAPQARVQPLSLAWEIRF